MNLKSFISLVFDCSFLHMPFLFFLITHSALQHLSSWLKEQVVGLPQSQLCWLSCYKTNPMLPLKLLVKSWLYWNCPVCRLSWRHLKPSGEVYLYAFHRFVTRGITRNIVYFHSCQDYEFLLDANTSVWKFWFTGATWIRKEQNVVIG